MYDIDPNTLIDLITNVTKQEILSFFVFNLFVKKQSAVTDWLITVSAGAGW